MGESSVDGNFPMAVFDIPDNVKRVQVCRCSFPHRCSWFHLISVQLPASIGARGNIVDLPMSQSRHGPNNQIVPDTSTKQKWQPMPRYGTPRRVCCKQLPAASESCFRFRKGPSFVCCSSCPTLRQAAGLCPPSRSSAAPWSGPRRNVARITSKSRWNASDFDLKHHHKPSTKYNYMVSIEIMSGINLSIRKKTPLRRLSGTEAQLWDSWDSWDSSQNVLTSGQNLLEVVLEPWREPWNPKTGYIIWSAARHYKPTRLQSHGNLAFCVMALFWSCKYLWLKSEWPKNVWTLPSSNICHQHSWLVVP